MSKWTAMVRALNDRGMTYAQIADRVGLATSTVGDLANGRYQSPRGDAAVALAMLHAEKFPVCNSELDQQKAG